MPYDTNTASLLNHTFMYLASELYTGIYPSVTLTSPENRFVRPTL